MVVVPQEKLAVELAVRDLDEANSG